MKSANYRLGFIRLFCIYLMTASKIQTINLGPCSEFAYIFQDFECVTDSPFTGGKSASLYKIRYIPTQEIKALKIQKNTAESKWDLKMIRKFSKLEGVISLEDSEVDEDFVYQILEFAPNQSLGFHIKNPDSPLLDSDSKILEIFGNILETLTQIYELGFMHGDIKPGNIVFSRLNRPLLVDFDLSRKLESVDHAHGTMSFMSPELIRVLNTFTKHTYTSKDEVFALGVTLYLMLKRKRPYQLSYRYYDTLLDTPVEFDKGDPADIVHLIVQCLKKQEERVDLAQLYSKVKNLQVHFHKNLRLKRKHEFKSRSGKLYAIVFGMKLRNFWLSVSVALLLLTGVLYAAVSLKLKQTHKIK